MADDQWPIDRCRERGSGRARGEPHGVAQLAVAHDLAEQGRGATKLAAELAHDPRRALIDVYALAHQGRAIAIYAAMTVGRERTYATLQEVALQLLDVLVRRSHATRFAVLGAAPAKDQAPPLDQDLHTVFARSS